MRNFFRWLFNTEGMKYQTIPWIGTEEEMIVPQNFSETQENLEAISYEE